MILEIKLGLQYEPENLDINKVCFECHEVVNARIRI